MRQKDTRLHEILTVYNIVHVITRCRRCRSKDKERRPKITRNIRRGTKEILGSGQTLNCFIRDKNKKMKIL